jgi:hypothetical protein
MFGNVPLFINKGPALNFRQKVQKYGFLQMSKSSLVLIMARSQKSVKVVKHCSAPQRN